MWCSSGEGGGGGGFTTAEKRQWSESFILDVPPLPEVGELIHNNLFKSGVTVRGGKLDEF